MAPAPKTLTAAIAAATLVALFSLPAAGAPEEGAGAGDFASGPLRVESAGSPGQSREWSREALRALSAERRKVYFPYIDGEREAVVVPLATLAERFPEADSLMAYCRDGYVSYYPKAFLEAYRPFLVLDLAATPRGDLRLSGGPDLGPYYITFSARVERGSAALPDPDNKRPFGVERLVFGDRETLVGPLFEEPVSELAPAAERGRELWTHNCMSCHAWGTKGGGPGGHLSNRTAPVVAIHAKHNDAYFHDYVRDPSTFIPGVKMPKHPHYTDAQIDAIQSFIAKVAP